MKNIVLIGFMGTGKTTVGRVLADKLGWVFVDSDEEIEKITGMTVPEIFNNHGPAYFRAEETRVIKELSARDALVIATGGGVVLNPENVTALKSNGWMVLLRCSPETIRRRVDSVHTRPLLAGTQDLQGRIEELLLQREDAYTGAADFDVWADEEDKEVVAEKIIRLVRERK